MPPITPSLREFLPDGTRFELDPHQIKGVSYMIRNSSFLQGDEMRLGKCIMAMTCCAIIHDYGYGSKFIVVCPNATKANWRDEILEKTHMKVVVLNGTPPQREKQWAQFEAIDTGGRWLVLNYEQVEKNLDRINANGFDIAIFDECHALKNPYSKRTRATLKIKARQYYPMTGSIFLNHVNELWVHFHRIDPTLWPNYHAFMARYCVFGGYKDKQVVGVKNQAELTEYLKKIMIRRERKEVYPNMEKVVLPPVYIEFDPEQRKIYDQAKNEMLISLPGGVPTNGLEVENTLAQMLRLKQICGGMAVVDPAFDDVSPKFDKAMSLVEEFLDNDRRVVLFTQFRGVLELLAQRMIAAKMMPFQLHGGVAAMDRNAVIKCWAAADPQPLLVMLQVGGVGLNMTAASDAIFLDKLWVPALNEQAEDRITGRDQKGVAMIHTLAMRDSIEQYIERLLDRKSKVFQQVVETGSWKRELIAMLKSPPIPVPSGTTP